MYRIVKVVLITAGLVALLAAGSLAQAPHTLMYQGKLATATGPVSSPVSVTFRIYESLIAPTALWTEIHGSLTPNELGVFTVELGSITPFGAEVFDGSVRYLGITVGADEEMTPRQLITSVPYTISTADAPPGVANYERESFYYYPSTGSFTIDSIDISIPGPGYVEVTAGGYPNMFVQSGTTQELWFLISKTFDDANFANPGVMVVRALGTYPGNWAFPVVVTRLYAEAAGTHRYYFTTRFIGAGTPNVGQIYMRAVYYPNAYGDINNLPLVLPKAASQVNSAGEETEN